MSIEFKVSKAKGFYKKKVSLNYLTFRGNLQIVKIFILVLIKLNTLFVLALQMKKDLEKF